MIPLVDGYDAIHGYSLVFFECPIRGPDNNYSRFTLNYMFAVTMK
jgi:hypothetical protein